MRSIEMDSNAAMEASSADVAASSSLDERRGMGGATRAAGVGMAGRETGAGGGDIDAGGDIMGRATGASGAAGDPCGPSAATAPRTCVMRRPTAEVAMGVGAVAAGEMVAAKLEMASSPDAFKSPVRSR